MMLHLSVSAYWSDTSGSLSAEQVRSLNYGSIVCTYKAQLLGSNAWYTLVKIRNLLGTCYGGSRGSSSSCACDTHESWQRSPTLVDEFEVNQLMLGPPSYVAMEGR